ncbi:MAG: phosphodiester glycosidase family protein [Clostridia bacterium]|nr:phosphodiester glycosidase family protein [Clostridia bacterium]
MKLSVRILLSVLCAAMVLAMPFVLSAPKILGVVRMEMEDMIPGEDEGWLRRLLPTACAEEIQVETETAYALPVDFTPGYAPDEALFTEGGYEDDSIRVQMETREEDGVIWRIAWVEVASPTQLRTGIAGAKVTATSAKKLVPTMAKEYNAVVAMNGDWYTKDPQKTTFEYRMGQKIRNKTNRKKDILIIDENGDFHTFIKSQGVLDFEKDTGHQIVNAFTFGPALVQEGQVLKMDKEYGYNPNGQEPRSAIGQLDRLSYVLVIAEGRGESAGVTHQQLADFMGALGCLEAFNLDGGGTAVMVFHGQVVNNLGGSPREQSDIIYFATAVSPEE